MFAVWELWVWLAPGFGANWEVLCWFTSDMEGWKLFMPTWVCRMWVIAWWSLPGLAKKGIFYELSLCIFENHPFTYSLKFTWIHCSFAPKVNCVLGSAIWPVLSYLNNYSIRNIKSPNLLSNLWKNKSFNCAYVRAECNPLQTSWSLC